MFRRSVVTISDFAEKQLRRVPSHIKGNFQVWARSVEKNGIKEIGPLTFGKFLRAARDLLELSQTDMARKLKISRGTLCDLEKGRQLVSPKLAVRIARTAGLSETVAVEACLQDQLNKANIKLKVALVA